MDRDAGWMTLLFIALVTLLAYVKFHSTYLVMNGKTFVQVGMMEINDNGTVLYTPVYKRK